MVRSMTGYGNAKGQIGGQQVSVEIRSLNSKFLELNLRLPLAYRDRELELRAEAGKQIERGKADITISIENNELSKRSTVNKEVFQAYFEELSELGREYHLSDVNLFDILLRMPAVMNSEKPEADEEQFVHLRKLISTAMEKFNAFRDQEGKVLQTDMVNRIQSIQSQMPLIAEMEQPRIDAIRARLEKNLQEIQDQTSVDRNRYEQELIYYIEKFDISEEKVRLKSHCDYFLQVLESPEANGKKLGFITQEIGREINTIGSKANDAGMQRIVVGMKDELEKVKEQLANVL